MKNNIVHFLMTDDRDLWFRTTSTVFHFKKKTDKVVVFYKDNNSSRFVKLSEIMLLGTRRELIINFLFGLLN